MITFLFFTFYIARKPTKYLYKEKCTGRTPNVTENNKNSLNCLLDINLSRL